MLNGDLSNVLVPRVLIVWENLIAVLPDADTKAKYDRHMKWGRWKRANELWEPNDIVCKRIWDISWRLDVQVDAVTWLGGFQLPFVKDWIAEMDLPIRRVTSENLKTFPGKLVSMPDVAALYDPDPTHQFTWGSRGRIVNEENEKQVGMF